MPQQDLVGAAPSVVPTPSTELEGVCCVLCGQPSEVMRGGCRQRAKSGKRERRGVRVCECETRVCEMRVE